MFRQVVVFGVVVGLTIELYSHGGLPHLPETIEVPPPLTAPTIVASGSIITPYTPNAAASGSTPYALPPC